jgi:hypothetical protein
MITVYTVITVGSRKKQEFFKKFFPGVLLAGEAGPA